ncbi:MAG: hypothetical protein IKV75_04205 [Bacteroidales bacterium]|nr:hypothetical protein [Bacteroidales bacterium]
MKKLFSKVAMAVAAVLLLSGCGVNMNLVTNHNLNQTNVVLSQKNFHVVKSVEAEVSAKYYFGIGGTSKKYLHDNVVAELTKNAGLTGSQALVNVTVHNSAKVVLFVSTVTYYAEGTVIEFDE